MAPRVEPKENPPSWPAWPSSCVFPPIRPAAGMGAARGAVDPLGRAVAVMLLLPDRNARLGCVDYVAAGLKGGGSVPGSDPDPDREVAQFEASRAVHACGPDDLEFSLGFGQDPFPLLFRERGVGLVVQGPDGAPIVLVAYAALEGDAGSRARVPKAAHEDGRIDRRVGQREAHRLSLRQPGG